MLAQVDQVVLELIGDEVAGRRVIVLPAGLGADVVLGFDREAESVFPAPIDRPGRLEVLAVFRGVGQAPHAEPVGALNPFSSLEKHSSDLYRRHVAHTRGSCLSGRSCALQRRCELAPEPGQRLAGGGLGDVGEGGFQIGRRAGHFRRRRRLLGQAVFDERVRRRSFDLHDLAGRVALCGDEVLDPLRGFHECPWLSVTCRQPRLSCRCWRAIRVA